MLFRLRRAIVCGKRRSMMLIREMRPDDLSAVMLIQKRCYHAITPESPAVMASKLAAGAGCCFVCEEKKRVVGYLLGHPWRSDSAVALHQELEELPEECDSLYLHDMAVLPEMRGRGVGELLLRRFEEAARARKLAGSHLVAIQGAETFWRRMGYREKPGVDMEKLAGYGTAAFLMAKAF